jgi:hypothetical protein
MVSNWPAWKWVAASFLLVVALIASCIILIGDRASDGEWSISLNLRIARDYWVKAGSPDDPAPYAKFMGWCPSGTNGVFNVTQVIGGHTYRGLFADREQALPGRTLAITRDGDVLILEDSGAVKLIETSGRVRLLKP